MFQRFRTPIHLLIFWPFVKNASFLYLNRVWIVWRVWRVWWVSDPYPTIYTETVYLKFIIIAIEGLESLECLRSFKGFEPPSNYQSQSILSKCFWLYLMRVWSVWKVLRVWSVRYILCSITYLTVIYANCFHYYNEREFGHFGVFEEGWQFWRVWKVSNPYLSSYIFAMKNIFCLNMTLYIWEWGIVHPCIVSLIIIEWCTLKQWLWIIDCLVSIELIFSSQFTHVFGIVY